ncbi:hypothetical protein ACFQ88_22360 [Paenibacillus sp. NPDC056579]|uniref:hypothetical protein n=1 Tax=Paenibacillus sp. NPDC056579 TaxID=3345871 RepID=UPI003674083E
MTDPLRCMRELQYELKEWNEYIRDVESRISTTRMAESINGGNSFASEDDCKLKAMKEHMEQLLQMNPPALPKLILEWEEERMVMGKQYRELVTKWNEVKNKGMPGLNPQIEKAERRLHLDSIASKCQTLLEQGFVLCDQIERERKHHEQDVADFETHQQNEIQQLRGHIQRLEDKQSLRFQHAQHAKRLPKMEERLKDGNEERHRVLAAIESVQNFLLRYAAMQVEEANQVFHHAEILLTTKRETEGSITLQYRLLYDKKVYYSLSSSEKISCSFDLSKLAALQGQGRIPVFIDGEESKEAFWASQIQYFVTTRIPDAALSYEVIVA